MAVRCRRGFCCLKTRVGVVGPDQSINVPFSRASQVAIQLSQRDKHLLLVLLEMRLAFEGERMSDSGSDTIVFLRLFNGDVTGSSSSSSSVSGSPLAIAILTPRFAEGTTISYLRLIINMHK